MIENKKNGIISIYNDDDNVDETGMISIEMEEKNLNKIITFFKPFINNKQDIENYFNITHFGVPGVLKLELSFYTNKFSITGRFSEGNLFIKNDSDYFHEFELESITKNEWDKIINLLNNNEHKDI